ncbi:MAG: solute carrier family 23 protein [Actinomycetaceae bacterium]|nr:solute carrier family 23 protein [Actinomycetaceae bacterium]MDY5854606.1 solute carrier family 23 protein [Arcanobacterium sp.]
MNKPRKSASPATPSPADRSSSSADHRTSPTDRSGVHPVDRVPPAGKLTLLSIQHVLAFYAGAVIVPLLIASSLNLDAATTIHLINADLLTCGIATLIQSVGITKHVGVRLPVIQGVTTTAVAPIIAIGLAATGGEGGVAGLPAIYGSIIVAGLFTFFAAPFFAKLLRFFPSVVTGTVLLVMGTSLLSVSANDFINYAQGVPKARDLAYGFGTLVVIVLVQRFFKGFVGTIAVLIGLVGGTAVAYILGDVDGEKVAAISSSAPIGITTPFYFGIPVFTFTGIISMMIVMIITMVETTGDVFAAGEIVGKRISKHSITAAIRADGISTLLGGILNSFPYTMFAQNVGLVRMTGVKSRWVATGAGAIMIVLGLVPKAGAVVNTIPSPVLGGASLILFANVAWVGLQTIAKADLRDGRNAVIVTTSLGLAMLVTFKPEVAQVFPPWAQVFFSAGMVVGSICAIILNILFFHVGRRSAQRDEQGVVALAGGEPVSLHDVNNMSRERFVQTFSSLFNEQKWPLESAWEQRPFSSVADVRLAVQSAVLMAQPENQHRLVADYPSMYELITAEDTYAASISSDSGSLALHSASEEELAQLKQISEQYLAKFGMPYVARLAPQDSMLSIINTGARRLSNSAQQERLIALSEVVEIANERLDILLREANPIRREWQMD